jgi:hypothetical protein
MCAETIPGRYGLIRNLFCASTTAEPSGFSTTGMFARLYLQARGMSAIFADTVKARRRSMDLKLILVMAAFMQIHPTLFYPLVYLYLFYD